MTIEQRAGQFLLRLYELTSGDITVEVDYSQHQAEMGLAGLDQGQWHKVTGLLRQQGLATGVIGGTTAKITTSGIHKARQHQS